MAEDTFISHLMELRDRLIRALLAIAAVTAVLTIWPGIGGGGGSQADNIRARETSMADLGSAAL